MPRRSPAIWSLLLRARFDLKRHSHPLIPNSSCLHPHALILCVWEPRPLAPAPAAPTPPHWCSLPSLFSLHMLTLSTSYPPFCVPRCNTMVCLLRSCRYSEYISAIFPAKFIGIHLVS